MEVTREFSVTVEPTWEVHVLLPHKLTADDLAFLGCPTAHTEPIEQYLSPASWQGEGQVEEACYEMSRQVTQLFWDRLITGEELLYVQRIIRRTLELV